MKAGASRPLRDDAAQEQGVTDTEGDPHDDGH